jgi:two-component system cell cycle response regulator DivK
MAGETVLVVDDAPVNLKLTDILLRKEGYKVHTVPDAEEALRVLRNFRPDVMLVDIQLPGMNGLELTKRVKQDPRTSDMIVIALTACAMREDQDRAMSAGCDGFITKPIDTHTLGPRIREHLDGHAASIGAPASAPPPTLPGGLALSTVEMESLRRRFLEEGILQSRQLLMDAGVNFDVAKASDLIHKWIGAAGALGYGAIAGFSRDLEELLSTSLLEKKRLDQKKLRELLSELVMAFSDPREAGISLPDSIMKELAGKRVAMVGFAEDEAERLCAIFEYLGALPRLFDTDEPPQSELVRNCDAVMVHVRPETMDSKWLDPEFQPPVGKALLLVGGREAILALDHAVQSRAREFLIDGWQPEEAVMRLSYAITRGSVEAPALASAPADSNVVAPPVVEKRRPPRTLDQVKVVLADDDPTVVAILRATLREYNVDCRVATSGDEALRLIEACQPMAAVLDVNMPIMSGFEVLSAIREQELPVKCIMLTARRQENDVIHGFDLGADDYVLKPFNAMEVVVRLKRMLCR